MNTLWTFLVSETCYLQAVDIYPQSSLKVFNPYPWIFGAITERVFWIKSRIIGNMLCCTKIYGIFGTVTERASRKKFLSTGTYTSAATLRSGFFYRKTRSVTVPDSRIRVNYKLYMNLRRLFEHWFLCYSYYNRFHYIMSASTRTKP